jgi:putative DNA methylase
VTAIDRPSQPSTAGDGAISGTARSLSAVENRLIDHWFPCVAVDETVRTPAGSGRSEKALFTWFASRPVAQARAAVLTTLLPDDDTLS